MTKFKLPAEKYSLGTRLYRELTLLFIMFVLILFFVGINVVYLTTLLLMYTLLLSMKRSRIVTHIIFNDKQQKLTIKFYYLIFFKGKTTISYKDLQYKYGLKRFGFGAASPTIEFFQHKKLQAEIHEQGNWKWDLTTLETIYKKLQEVK